MELRLHFSIYTFLLMPVMFWSCSEKNEPHSSDHTLPLEASHKTEKVFSITEPEQDHFFNRVFDMEFFSNGNFVVWNSGGTKIFEFSSGGTLISSFGREGRGPGEFRDILRAFASSDSTLHVFDQMNGRQMVLTKQNTEWEVQRTADFMYRSFDLTSTLPDAIVDTSKFGYKAFFNISPSGTNNDTLSRSYSYSATVDSNLNAIGEPFRYKPVGDMAILKTQSSGTFALNPRFFKAFYLFDPNTQELIYIRNNSNKIIAIQTSGEEYIKGLLPFEKFKPDPEEVEASMEWFKNYQPTMIPLIKDKILEFEPYFKKILLIDEQLWIQVSRQDSFAPNWIVTSLEGEVLKSFSIPEKFNLFGVSNNILIGIQKDEEEAEYLTGYRLSEVTVN